MGIVLAGVDVLQVLVALTRWSTHSLVSQALAVQFETLGVLAFAALAPSSLLRGNHLVEELLLVDSRADNLVSHDLQLLFILDAEHLLVCLAHAGLDGHWSARAHGALQLLGRLSSSDQWLVDVIGLLILLSHLVDLVVRVVMRLILRLLQHRTLLLKVRVELIESLEIDAVGTQLKLVFQIGAHVERVHGLLLGLHVLLVSQSGSFLGCLFDVTGIIKQGNVSLVLGGGLHFLWKNCLVGVAAPLSVLHIQLLVKVHNNLLVNFTIYLTDTLA